MAYTLTERRIREIATRLVGAQKMLSEHVGRCEEQAPAVLSDIECEINVAIFDMLGVPLESEYEKGGTYSHEWWLDELYSDLDANAIVLRIRLQVEECMGTDEDGNWHGCTECNKCKKWEKNRPSSR